MPGPALDEDFFARPVGVVARELLGCTLEHDGAGGVIVEVERYQEDDPASHSYGGPRGRNTVMFGPPGRAYVYRSYGVHWCLNLVCGPAGAGAAVLLRALEPRTGLELMRARRGPVPDRLLCAGPGRLAQALGVDASLNGVALSGDGPLRVLAATASVRVVRGPRIGITRAAERPWRLGVAGSAYLSRPFPKAA
ncbi:MAG TPA: DNA-3-methyladenine glycosylase [Miltoncostaeaceae bacterium]|nr:DNA-3-methyladenine glycosylase [Miltoncostaeaceae bacterium]